MSNPCAESLANEFVLYFAEKIEANKMLPETSLSPLI